MKLPKDMTREELEDEVSRLRLALNKREATKADDGLAEVLTRRKEGPFVSSDVGRAQTGEMLRRKSDALARTPLATSRVEEFLSYLGRLSTRFDVALDRDAGGDLVITTRSEDFGGYAARQASCGLVIEPYRHGIIPEGGDIAACGDDMHPDAREARAQAWREENAEALAEQSRLVEQSGAGLPWLSMRDKQE